MLDMVQNFPLVSILMCMVSGIITSALGEKKAKWLNMLTIAAAGGMSLAVLFYCLRSGSYFVYKAGQFPAPWGNELRAGVLEGGMAAFFCIIMLLSLCGGRKKLFDEVVPEKHNLYYVLISLLLSSLLALVYTNDIFTAYVFVEINTISACGLIMIRQNGRTIVSAVRYMIMSLLGSGLLLMGICMVYDITGQLLMSPIQTAMRAAMIDGIYREPLLIAIGFMSIGLAIKSALFPFHAWLPEAYGYSTVSSAAILSSLVSKGYIFLLLKIIYRVVGFDVFWRSKIIDVLFLFALCGMIFGSIGAIRENDIRRMIAYSSVAQIGYIYMGIGMGTYAGMNAAVFHILSHAATKSLLFIAAIGLTDVSNGSRHFIDLTGSGYRNRISGVTFTVGSLSMVGVPLFSGFISKLLFAEAAILNNRKMLPALIVLGISTILNAIYFMKTVIRIYTPIDEKTFEETKCTKIHCREQKLYTVICILFIVLNVVLGVLSQPIVDLISSGLLMFG